jgi:hypothetical protein
LHPILNMPRYQAILINISHDYNVVIDPYSYHHIIMKFIILRLNTAAAPADSGEPEARGRWERGLGATPEWKKLDWRS